METNNKPDFYKLAVENGHTDVTGLAALGFISGGEKIWNDYVIPERKHNAEMQTMRIEWRDNAIDKINSLESENQALKSELRQLENRNYKLEAQGEFIPKDQSLEIQRLKSELLDALDLKEGHGPTALSMLSAERDRLKSELDKVKIHFADHCVKLEGMLQDERLKVQELNNELEEAVELLSGLVNGCKYGITQYLNNKTRDFLKDKR